MTMSVFDPSSTPVLRVRGLSKTFPGTRALRDLSIEVAPGEIHALVGQNGCGKSTLVKILAGFHHADPGAEAWIDGELMDLADVAAQRHERLRFVHQDLGLVLELGVMDNLALRHDFVRGRFRRIDWRAQAQEAARHLARFGVEMDVRRPLSEATPVERVIVAIVAALQGWEGGRGVLVLDEPTALLPPGEVATLFDIVAEVRRGGTSVIYVSHRLDEIFELADRVSVVRSGELVATEQVSEITPTVLASLMVGEDVDAEYRADIAAGADAAVALEARDLRGAYLDGVSLTLRKGEVLGVAGLLGSGREELPYALAGALGKGATGSVRVPDRSEEWIDITQVGALGMPIVPADRTREAMVAEFSVGENLTLSILDRLRRGPALNAAEEGSVVARWMRSLQVRAAGPGVPITALSGGNQQKVIIARCLARDPSILLLCEPTAGVDIGSRIAIYDLIARQAQQGLAVVVSSADIGDLLAVCTRVIVLRDGRPVREIEQSRLSQSTLLHAMEGTDDE